MTAREAVRRLDDLRPNAIPLADKLAVLSDLETRIARDLFGREDAVTVGEDDILAASGNAGMYHAWLCAALDFEAGDAERQKRDLMLFDAAYREYAASVVRRGTAGGKLKVGARDV